MEKAELKRLLDDIVFWSERLASHIDGMTESRFTQNIAICDAVCWCISCIGEAAGAIRRRWPELEAELELSHAYAMRNRIAHGYFTIDLGIVWMTANSSVPAIGQAARNKINAL
jgi:uncharacterized protein with HEPN domain